MQPLAIEPSQPIASMKPGGQDETRASSEAADSARPAEARRQPPHILIVEDNEADILLIEEALRFSKIGVTTQVVRDGEKAIQYLDKCDHANATAPALVILDLNLPRQDGFDVLRQIRNSAVCRKALVLIATSSDAASDRGRASGLGADGYFKKPAAYDAYLKLGEVVRGMLSGSGNLF